MSGLLLLLLGIWGALIPFIGPYFDYSYGTDSKWHWTNARFWLEVLPGAAIVVGALLLIVSANRVVASVGGWLAALGGAWFVIGLSLAPSLRIGDIGQPLSGTRRGQAAAHIGYFYGLGAVVLFLAAFALGRLAVVGVRDVYAANRRDELAATDVTAGDTAVGRRELGRRRGLRRDRDGDGIDDRDETVAEARHAAEPVRSYEDSPRSDGAPL